MLWIDCEGVLIRIVTYFGDGLMVNEPYPAWFNLTHSQPPTPENQPQRNYIPDKNPVALVIGV
jgi:hypothetical protein